MHYQLQSLFSSTLPVIIILVVYLSFTHAQIEVVSISPNYPHNCVNRCVFYDGSYFGLNYFLGCDDPVANKCYCPTASAAATRVDSYISSCATYTCSAGDISDDVVAMKSIYGSYCMGAGFTAPLVSKWYTPAETTSESRPAATTNGNGGSNAPTTTEVTVVTQTGPVTGSGSRLTQVTVQMTSTLWVRPQGTSTSVNIGDPGLAKKLGIGLGVGVPVLIVAIAIGVWLCLRKRRRSRAQAQAFQSAPPAPDMPFTQSTVESPRFMPVPIARKPVKSPTVVSSETPSSLSSPTTELSGGQGLRREIHGTEIHPFPVIDGNQRPVVVPGEHELYGQGAGAVPPTYQQSTHGRRDQHWELP